MERAELSLYLCKAKEKACKKYGPFICPSQLSKLTNCLPKLLEAHHDDLQVGDSGIGVKVPRWTAERNILIIDLSPERNDEITAFAIDDIPAGDTISIIDIMGILEQTTCQEILRGRALRKVNGEEVGQSNEGEES